MSNPQTPRASYPFVYRVIIAALFAAFFPITAVAETYHVDATLGDDTWTGTLSNPQASDGPWKTIGRANFAFLQPGDSILFKCGEAWREQLVVSYSGVPGNPITFGSYGTCNASNKPVIDGSIAAVPTGGWTDGPERTLLRR